ncbi:hypothetical protein [Secundilactobacillus kimchicus]|uniref:hypothetical protein n=1 Tax=Secundilactobacillus kimchicus TaxID=528209 RepID=UPI000A3D96E4|nr:hypothetical protein [Secundilactobacillus kimchicus]
MMDLKAIVERIQGNRDFRKLDEVTITQYAEEASEIIKQYEVPLVALNRAVYLYACYMLFSDFPNSANKYKTVKVEDATYTRFGDSPNNNYWTSFFNTLGRVWPTGLASGV